MLPGGQSSCAFPLEKKSGCSLMPSEPIVPVSILNLVVIQQTYKDCPS
jgi:hypothetical protein